MNVMKMMQQAQQMQAKMAKIQAELPNRRYEAVSAGGQIKAIASGDGQLVELKIAPELLKEDAEMLQDLIVTAVREALDKGKAEAAEEMSKLMPPGMKLPGM